MKLYHGTSERAARLILRDGLRPRSQLEGTPSDGNWQATVPSNPDAVYLTTAYAPFFASVAANDGEQKLAIIEVDTERMDSGLFRPDEDFLEQATRGMRMPYGPPKRAGMKARTIWYRDHIHMYAGKDSAWNMSIEMMGTCAYYGTIPTDAITRVVLFDQNQRQAQQMLWMAMDPCIDIQNYAFCGGKYRALTRWFIGERVEPVELFTSAGATEWALIPEAAKKSMELMASDQSALQVIKP